VPVRAISRNVRIVVVGAWVDMARGL